MKHAVRLVLMRHLTSARTIGILAALWVLRALEMQENPEKTRGNTPPDGLKSGCAMQPSSPNRSVQQCAERDRAVV
jgi:hypothetical protein